MIAKASSTPVSTSRIAFFIFYLPNHQLFYHLYYISRVPCINKSCTSPSGICSPVLHIIRDRLGSRPFFLRTQRVKPVFNQPQTDIYDEDRKSTRLNSSHVSISYAVFCLKNK